MKRSDVGGEQLAVLPLHPCDNTTPRPSQCERASGGGGNGAGLMVVVLLQLQTGVAVVVVVVVLLPLLQLLLMRPLLPLLQVLLMLVVVVLVVLVVPLLPPRGAFVNGISLFISDVELLVLAGSSTLKRHDVFGMWVCECVFLYP